MVQIQIYTVHVRSDGNEYVFWRDDTTQDILNRSFKNPATLYMADGMQIMGGKPVLHEPVMSLVDVIVRRDGVHSSVVRVQDPIEYLDWVARRYELHKYTLIWDGETHDCSE